MSDDTSNIETEGEDVIDIYNVYPRTVLDIQQSLSEIDGFELSEDNKLESFVSFIVDKIEVSEDDFLSKQRGLVLHELMNNINLIPRDYINAQKYLEENDEHMNLFLNTYLSTTLNARSALVSLFDLSVQILKNPEGVTTLQNLFSTLPKYYLSEKNKAKGAEHVEINFNPDLEIPSKYLFITRTLLYNAFSAGSTEISLEIDNGKILITDNAPSNTLMESDFNTKIANILEAYGEKENLQALLVEIESNSKRGLTMSVNLLLYEYLSKNLEVPEDFISLEENENGTKTLSFRMI